MRSRRGGPFSPSSKKTSVRGAAFALLLLAACGGPAAGPEPEGAWRPLWNGKDWTGWERWLGKPHPMIEVPGHPRNEKGDYAGVVGVDKDPAGVYSIVPIDGEPAIRISGEIWGGLTTRQEFENYHLRLEVKWGEKRWPPRDRIVRDTGLLYHAAGPHGALGTFWKKSFECQIQENDFGDFFPVAGVIADVEAVKDERGLLVYARGAPKVKGVVTRVVRNPMNERPRGEWNLVELVCLGDRAVHVVNGRVNMALTGLRHGVDGREVPLTRGQLQLQSEGAEVYFRRLEIRPIREIPQAYGR